MSAAVPRLPAHGRPAWSPTREDHARLWRLALPIVVVQSGMMALGVVATILVGHVSDLALGALALGNLYGILLLLLAWGTLMALDPLVAQAVGARDDEALALAVQRGIVLAAGLTVVTALACLPVRPLLLALRQPAGVVPGAERFVFLSIPGVLPFLVFIVLRQTLQAMGRLRAIVAVVVGANVIHLALCWALVFGRLGCPALEVSGAALAGTITRWLMAAATLALAWPVLRPALARPRRAALAWPALAHMLRIGLPIGGQMVLEFGVFAVVGVFAGWLGTVAIGANQVALQVASATFMVPQGVGAAAAALVGRSVGAGDAAGARRAATASLGGGVACMALSGLALWLGARPVAALFSSDPAVVRGSAALLPIAAAFQVFDGVQVVAMGVLRGVGDTRVPMLVTLVGYWLAGLPVSLLLGFALGGGLPGMWWGLAAGLGAVAVILVIRLRRRLARPLARIRVPGAAAG